MNGSDADSVDLDRFKTILLATDGSEFSAGVERVGIEMAAVHQSQLHVLRLLLTEPGKDIPDIEREEAMLDMARISDQCAERGVACTPLIKLNHEPSHGILTAAKEIDARLVIMGRRGRRGMAKFMVGDATTKVIEKADCSVLIVPRLVSFWNSGVLLVIDPTQTEGDDVAHAAFLLAHATNLPLTILMVADEKEDDAERREVYQSVNRLVATAKLQNIAADGLVQSGNIDDVTLEVARQRSADIIVCEPRERSVIDKLFNANNLVHLIGQAHCPVLVAKGC